MGRQGWVPLGIVGLTARNNVISDTGRSIIDFEPTSSTQLVKNVLIEDLTVVDAYGVGAFISGQGDDGEFDGITIRRVTANDNSPMYIFIKNIPPGIGARRKNILIEDCDWRCQAGNAGGSGLWAFIHFSTTVGTNGVQGLTVRNNYFEGTSVPAYEGGVRLKNSDSVDVHSNTFVNLYDYGGTPTWYKDDGGNTNTSVS
jgi:hypothetical protein